MTSSDTILVFIQLNLIGNCLLHLQYDSMSACFISYFQLLKSSYIILLFYMAGNGSIFEAVFNSKIAEGIKSIKETQ